MPVTSAARKAHSRSLKLRDRNYTVKTAMKATLKFVKKLASAGKPLVQTQLQEAYSKIDKALKVGVLHKNTAARRKASVAKLFQKQAS